jgi:hypothetical protein
MVCDVGPPPAAGQDAVAQVVAQAAVAPSVDLVVAGNVAPQVASSPFPSHSYLQSDLEVRAVADIASSALSPDVGMRE